MVRLSTRIVAEKVDRSRLQCVEAAIKKFARKMRQTCLSEFIDQRIQWTVISH
jgi:hypothetical protein